MDNGLLEKIMSDENYGKGLITLPEGTAVPEGEVVYFRFRDERGGAGMMQSTIVYVCQRELSRDDDGRYYYSFYMLSEGKETDERYLVPDKTVKVFDRLVKNTCLAGCNTLKHDYIPGLMSPINTPSPIYNMALDLKTENGETVKIPLSSFDISSNGGGDVLIALFTLLDSIRNDGKLIPKAQEMKAEETVQPLQGTWKCMCGETNTGNFCIMCGAKRS